MQRTSHGTQIRSNLIFMPRGRRERRQKNDISALVNRFASKERASHFATKSNAVPVASRNLFWLRLAKLELTFSIMAEFLAGLR